MLVSSTSTPTTSSSKRAYVLLYTWQCIEYIVDALLQDKPDKKHAHAHLLTQNDPNVASHTYGARYGTSSFPKFKMPSTVRS